MIRTENKRGLGWDAPCLSDPAAIRAQMEEYRLTGRRIDLLHLGGFSHFHTREWIEEDAFARLEDLDEEERLKKSRYGSIPGDMRFDCCVLLDSTFSVEFMDGKALVIASPGEPVFRMSSNPYDRWGGGRRGAERIGRRPVRLLPRKDGNGGQGRYPHGGLCAADR